MFNQLMAVINLPEGANAWQKLVVGLEIALIGITVVFVMLAILVLVTWLFKKFFYDAELKKAGQTQETLPAATAPVLVASNLSTQSDDLPIAAITAALTVMLADECNADSNVKFVVRQIKKF